MEIHKPKPIHNWRELTTEIAVIVIGILIALSLEQMVENWHERKQYREARDAMHDELNYDVSNISRREKFEPCIRQRLNDITTLLNRAEKHEPFDAPSWIGNAASLRIRFTAEPEASRSGLFSSKEQATFGRLYSYLHSVDVEQDRERMAWGRLQMLEGRGSLSPEMIFGARAALADARYEHDRIELLLRFVKVIAPQAEVHGDVDIFKAANVRFEPDAWAHCLPMNTPKEKGEKLSYIVPNPS